MDLKINTPEHAANLPLLYFIYVFPYPFTLFIIIHSSSFVYILHNKFVSFIVLLYNGYYPISYYIVIFYLSYLTYYII